MSEIEIKRRQDYKRNRKKWILAQAIVLAVVCVIALSSFIVYDRMNRTYYIEYTENSSVDYKVQYVPNVFFEEEWIGSGQSYVSSLVNAIEARFKYRLDMDRANVGFDYTYSIDAQLVVADKNTGDHIFDPIEELVPTTTVTARNTDKVIIEKGVTIDFNKYNAQAHKFITSYGLTNANPTLLITMKVNVISQCDEFETNNENNHSISLVVPLGEENFSITNTSGAPSGESKVLACKGMISQEIFLVVAIVCAVIALILGILLLAFVYFTTNEDINYVNKIKKILHSYRSFIQQIEGEFDTEGYQIVPIKSFVEMLGIRDTIQSPILMWENKDETMTQFLIPTATKLLYVFEIKVENYDLIYGLADEEPVHGTVYEFADEDAIILEDTVDMDDLAEAMATPDVVLEEIDFVEEEDEVFEATEEEPGIEVVGVVWPERRKKNKVYKYDPNGESLNEGDMVLVPTRDEARDREVIRKAAIAHGNYRIDPETHPHTIKKIIGVIRHHAEAALTPKENEEQ